MQFVDRKGTAKLTSGQQCQFVKDLVRFLEYRSVVALDVAVSDGAAGAVGVHEQNGNIAVLHATVLEQGSEAVPHGVGAETFCGGEATESGLDYVGNVCAGIARPRTAVFLVEETEERFIIRTGNGAKTAVQVFPNELLRNIGEKHIAVLAALCVPFSQSRSAGVMRQRLSQRTPEVMSRARMARLRA